MFFSHVDAVRASGGIICGHKSVPVVVDPDFAVTVEIHCSIAGNRNEILKQPLVFADNRAEIVIECFCRDLDIIGVLSFVVLG